MIKRENIKQAIDAISQRDAEIGYTLDEMLGRGIIDAPSAGEETMLGDDFFFFFDNNKARVSKFLYISKGTVPIEERLLVKYGELLKKRELMERGAPVDDPSAVKVIRSAGLRFMVAHEIDYAINRIKKGCGSRARQLIPLFENLKQQTEPLSIPSDGNDPLVLYRGFVDTATPAFFIRFPFSTDALMQAADINLEFFHIRFFINCIIEEQIENCFACVVDNRIVGFIYLIFKEQMLFRNLVIDFVATARGKTGDPSALKAPRGVGTFLVAGVWLHWKTGGIRAKNIILDSEIEARGFYKSVGFAARGFSGFVLVTPKGYLLRSILTMKSNHFSLPPPVVQEIGKLMIKQVKSLRKKAKTERQATARKAGVEAVKEFLRCAVFSEYAKDILQMLLKFRDKVPETADLIDFASKHGSFPARDYAAKTARTGY